MVSVVLPSFSTWPNVQLPPQGVIFSAGSNKTISMLEELDFHQKTVKNIHAW